MARNAITQDKIIEMNELYLELKTYAAVAREIGCAASTVKKYIIPNYTAAATTQANRIEFDKSTEPNFNLDVFLNCDWAQLCVLTEKELNDLEELKREFVI